MRKPLKIASSVLLIFLLAGCAGFRKGKTTESAGEPAAAGYAEIISSVIDNNITPGGFEIRKGSIELEGTEIEGKFGLHARLNSKGDFFGSVRGPRGIERVRLLMGGDDVAAIDRFNRTVYVGKKSSVLAKNGMPEDFMTIIFGDMPSESSGNFSAGGTHEISVVAGNDEFTRDIAVCLDEMKICSQKVEALTSGHEILLSFGNFVSRDGRKYASLVTMEEKKKMFHVKLFIDDIIFGYDSDIEFSLPSYKRVSL
jgi:hypothetical protein